MIARKPTSFEKEKLRLAGLCAKSEQCEFDIRTKLHRTTLTSSEKEEILNFLIDNKFIDNARFCGSFIRDKVRFAKWGRIKIKHQLAAKRIPSSIFLPLLKDIDEEQYMENAYTLLKAKSRGLNLNKMEDVAKLYRYLFTRGYESNVINASLKRLRSNIEKENDEDN